VLVSLACLLCSHMAHADPIHAVADGAFWHHDSGWIFPEKIGEFTRVGAAQDVAGSSEAVAHYAAFASGSRIVASVHVYPADSDTAQSESESGKLLTDGAFVLGNAQALSATKRIYVETDPGELIAIYLVTAGEWRVRVRFSGAPAKTMPSLDAFVLGQRWETLTSAQTLR